VKVQRKLNKCADVVHQKLSKLVHACFVETTVCQGWRVVFLRQCRRSQWYFVKYRSPYVMCRRQIDETHLYSALV